MQKAFMDTIYDLSISDDRINLLTSDNGTDYDIFYKRKFNERYINVGISEQAMIGIASGMALCGDKPYVVSSASFLCYRGYEFIRNNICMQNTNVKLIALGSGLSISQLGPTHHTTEDIAILNVLPNLEFYSLSTPKAVRMIIEKTINDKDPCYFRLGMNSTFECYDNIKFNYDINMIVKGEKILFVSTGEVLENVVSASRIIYEKDNFTPSIVDIIKIKPFNEKKIALLLKGYKLVVVVEDHSVIGGLSSIIDSIIIKNDINIKKINFGLDSRFALGYGTRTDMYEKNNLSTKKIVKETLRYLYSMEE